MCVYFATDIDRINNEYMPRLDLEIGRYINYSKLESIKLKMCRKVELFDKRMVLGVIVP